MSEELNIEPISALEPAHETAVLEPVVSEVADGPKVSKYETDAIAKGWKPKDQFSGDLEEFRPAKEWLERGELLDTIHSQNRQVKELKETVDHLAEFNKKIETVTRDRTIAELEARHRAAVEVGDVDAASKAAQDMVKVHAELPTARAPSAPGIPIEVSDFINRSSLWFNDNTAENAAMKAFAIRRDSEIASANPGISAKDAVALVEADVKRTFQHRFTAAPVSAVSAPSAAPVRSRDVGVSQLPEFHQKMVKNLQRSIKDFDVKNYISNLRKAGEIK